ncbi:MAG: tetratricopeptide repeat protein [Deltaproteobacteria bacterium]|nr:tetratricopeptide repeat protein [Deltaproteobacteria bacterium]
MEKNFSFRRLFPPLLILLGFIIYINALSAPFVYDDRGYITHNEAIKDLTNFLDLSGTRYIGFLSFAVNYYISGYTPFDYHLLNVLIHIVNSILIFQLVALTFKTPLLKAAGKGREGLSIAFAVSAIFLAHPVQTQAVTYITQRFTSLATLFYLLSIFLYVKSKISMKEGSGGLGPWVIYSGSLVSALLAMKTKEISFTLPFLLLLYEIVFFGIEKDRRSVAMRALFYLTVLIIPISLIGQGGDHVTRALRDLQLKEAAGLPRDIYVYTQFNVIMTYIRLLFLPINQRIDYAYPLSDTLFEPYTFVSFLILLTLFVSSVFWLRRSYIKKDIYGIFFSFGVIWFFMTLSIESFAVPIQDVIFEHRIYLPGIGFIMSVVSVLFYFMSFLERRMGLKVFHPAAIASIIIVLSAPLAYSTHRRNIVWGDELKLLDEAIGEKTGKSRLYYIRAMVYTERGEFEMALKDADSAVRLSPQSAEMHNIRGYAYSSIGRHEESIKDFNNALTADPRYYMAYFNRGRSYSFLKRYDLAIADYTKAIEVRPDYGGAYNNRGVIYAEVGDMENAGKDLSEACRMKHLEACDNLRFLKDYLKSGGEKLPGKAEGRYY